MNISTPIASSVNGVDFGILSYQDVTKLSVRQITNPQTFDLLLNPNPRGLYDLALGAALGQRCTTCRLDQRTCPGHCGHIELPVKVLHCVFVDQAYRLLRAQCHFCHRLRMAPITSHRYWCKLNLIRHGLLAEAGEIDDIGNPRISRKRRPDGVAFGQGLPDGEVLAVEVEVNSDDDGFGDEISIREKREAFVRKCISRARRSGLDLRVVQQDEAVLAARKRIITEFKTEMLSDAGRKCKHCKAISPSLRKDKARAIYRKPLTDKQRKENVINEITVSFNPLTALNRQQKRERQKAMKAERARAAEQIDEGVADLESSPSEDADMTGILGQIGGDSSGQSEEEEEVEQLDETGNPTVVQTSATTPKARKRRKVQEVATSQTFVNANEIHAFLALLFEREKEILQLVYQSSPDGPEPTADMFFVQNILVPPNKYRPETKTTENEATEPPDHQPYRKIMTLNGEILQIRRELQGQMDESRTRARLRNYDDLQRTWLSLQDAVNAVFDKDKSNIRGAAALKVADGIKQKLEKKEGIFRMNIMGKRVNFAARSVISPDPNIETTEIGVPPIFAKTLTYPDPVTAFSVEHLKQAVKNGPNKWPGANAVEYEGGQIVSLLRKSDDERLGIANLLLQAPTADGFGTRPKKVYRHLNNGDMVIMNRQPTLHKPSMMCHRARVLKGEKTIRMHYANCNTYNADFDGDEMNMHFPQNEFARAEAQEIADTDHQYLSATAGKPLRGLIQDHISMSTWLTCVDMFFTRAEYYELLYSCLRPEHGHVERDRIVTIEPAIMRPKARWTGKQLITTILLNVRPPTHAGLTMEAPCSTPGQLWDNKEDSMVRIDESEMLTGVLDKKLIGPSSGGLIHTIYELYGHTVAGTVTGIIGRLLTRMLNTRAFSCGIEDLLLTDKGNSARAENLTGAETVGMDVAAKYVSLTKTNPTSSSPELLKRMENVLREEDKQQNLDLLMNASTSELTSKIWAACLPEGLWKSFPRNQMQTMTISGAKGSNVNASQISCNLGQQVLEGRRVPVMISGKTLPSFKPFETSVRAGGYIIDRFLTGIRPQEYYFTLMAGREGLIDTAVKTSRSGYLQRCLIKGLEGLTAAHDSSVRDSDGTMIQAMYGEDGLEIIKAQKLFDFKFLSQNFLSLFASTNVRDDAMDVIQDHVLDYMKDSRKAVMKTGDLAASLPSLAMYPPYVYPGSVSEAFDNASRKYTNDNPDKTIRTKTCKHEGTVRKNFFQQMLNLKYARSVVEPGEAVGVVAGQSIGEPSTQMTLNTFHLAGFAAKNVTLGIPRLREILMTASRSIKKPTMTLYPIAEMTDQDCERWAKSISRLPLSQLIDHTSVEEYIGGSQDDSRVYKIHLHFYPMAEYTQEYAIKVEDVAKQLETTFPLKLRKAMRQAIRKRKDDNSLKHVPEVGKSAGRDRDAPPPPPVQEQTEAEKEAAHNPDRQGGDSDREDDGDDDATNAKQMANLDEGVTYEDPDDESEQEVEQQGERDAADEAPDSDEDEGYGGSEGMSDSDETSAKDPSTPRLSKSAAKKRASARENNVLEKIPEATSFRFDERTGDSCELTLEFPLNTPKILVLNLVNAATRETLIQEVSGLGQCTATVENSDVKNSPRVIMTEGANLGAMRKFQDVINPHRIHTNDIGAILTHYGVEAARNTIIAETVSVFKGHKIDVDVRHLMLVADYMTRDGGYLPFSRNGIKDKASPFAKMSFETTIGFLGGAVMDGESEGLESPSARITVGRLGRLGSGMSDVLMPVV